MIKNQHHIIYHSVLKLVTHGLLVSNGCSCFVTLPEGVKVPWVCLRCNIVVFPDHTHLFFATTFRQYSSSG